MLRFVKTWVGIALDKAIEQHTHTHTGGDGVDLSIYSFRQTNKEREEITGLVGWKRERDREKGREGKGREGKEEEEEGVD